MNTTNETAETPEQWARTFLGRVKYREPYDLVMPESVAELASVKAQADRAAAMEKALKPLVDAFEAECCSRSARPGLDTHERELIVKARTALSQTGGQK